VTLPLSNTAEGGSDGTAVTTANSGGASGNAWDAISLGGATGTYSNLQVDHGTLAYRIVQPASPVTAYVEWNSTSFGSGIGTVYFREYYYLTAAPASAQYPCIFMNATTRGPGFRININRTFQVSNGTTAVGTASTDLVPLNQWVRFEGTLTPSTSAMSGSVKMYTSMDSTVDPGASSTASASGIVGTVASLTGVRWGDQQGGTGNANDYFGDVNANVTGLPGPSATAAALLARSRIIRPRLIVPSGARFAR
jgi:hypothetical protein